MLKNNPFHYSIATRIRNSYFIKYLTPNSNDNILEVGCGVGYFCQLLYKYGPKIYGVDVSSESIEYCKRNIDGDFTIGDAESLDYEDHYFEKILCTEVLEHVEDDKKALKEMYRVLKPNGSLVMTIPTQDGIFGAKIKNIMHSHGEGPGKHEREGYSKKEIIELFESVGFKVDKIRYTMVFFTEIFMGITKIVYSIKTKDDHLDSQSEVQEVSNSLLFKILKIIFPVFLLISKLDDIFLHKILKGHMIVLRGIKSE